MILKKINKEKDPDRISDYSGMHCKSIEQEKTHEMNTVFFDGTCLLCNRTAEFIAGRDKKKRFRLMLLSDERAGDMMINSGLPPDTDSVILVEEGQIFTGSEAVIRICIALGFPWSLFVVLRLVPLKLRDKVYRWIARNRYRWFGRKDECHLPGC